MKKLTFGQIITIVSGLGGIIPILVELFQKGVEAFATCSSAAAPVWALTLVAFSGISAAFSKSFVDTLKGK
jgi:nicotinamide mononucleotide (NMN) deamidase PncC